MALPRPQRPLWRRALTYLLMFATAVLLVDALVGERGLVATTRARREAAEAKAALAELRAENARLTTTARELDNDPAAVEHAAREKLGLIRPGEVLVIIKDVKAASR
jgi:cell division protein FtsB